MQMELEKIWADPVWSKVISAGFIAVITAILQIRFHWFQRLRNLWAVKLVITTVKVSNEPGKGYPLKYWVELRNDSVKCVAVKLHNFHPEKITLKSLPPEVMQLRFSNRWLPSDPSEVVVAVLPGQLCRLWIGIDEKAHTEPEVKAATGNIGTLIISANRQQVAFKL
jgi:hypothetical protein